MAPHAQAPQPQEEIPRARTRLLAGLILLALVAGAAAFYLPWIPRPHPALADLDRYVPLRDGQSALAVSYGPDGAVIRLQSQNVERIASLDVFTALSPFARDIIDQRYYADVDSLDPDVLLSVMDDAAVTRLRVRSRSVTEEGTLGKADELQAVAVRDTQGYFLVELYRPADDLSFAYDPPMQLLPTDLSPGVTWQQEGVISQTFDYVVEGRILTDESPAGAGADNTPQECIVAQVTTVLRNQGSVLDETTQRDRICAGIGIVETTLLGPDGAVREASTAVSVDGHILQPALLTQWRSAPVPQTEIPTAPRPETLTRLMRMLPDDESGDASIPPAWLPTDPPMVLVAGYAGDLLALDETGAELWRFHTGGTIFGAPAFDAARGQIYLGSSDRILYALDTQGLFRWAVASGDNVATRPAVAGELVVFGSEDRTIYAVEAETGQERWRYTTGGAVTGSPLVVDDPAGGTLVVVGSDDGVAYALDAADGSLRWRHGTDAPLEADPLLVDDQLYLAGRDGSLAVLEPSGRVIWETEVHTGANSVLRTPPAVGAATLYLVDEAGLLHGLDRDGGRRRWISPPDVTYVGPPVVVQTPEGGEAAIVPRTDGKIDRLAPDGALLQQWDSTRLDRGMDPYTYARFSLGPTAGGDSLWLADMGAVLYRLGPEEAAP